MRFNSLDILCDNCLYSKKDIRKITHNLTSHKYQQNADERNILMQSDIIFSFIKILLIIHIYRVSCCFKSMLLKSNFLVFSLRFSLWNQTMTLFGSRQLKESSWFYDNCFSFVWEIKQYLLDIAILVKYRSDGEMLKCS